MGITVRLPGLRSLLPIPLERKCMFTKAGCEVNETQFGLKLAHLAMLRSPTRNRQHPLKGCNRQVSQPFDALFSSNSVIVQAETR